MKKTLFFCLFVLCFSLIIPILSVNAQEETWIFYKKGLFGNIYQNSLNPNEFQASISVDPQNYFLDGEFKPINLTILEINEGDYKYSMEKAPYKVYFPKFLTYSPIRFTVEKENYTWLIEEASYNTSDDYLGNPKQTVVSVNKNNEIVYSDAFNGLDANIIYELKSNGLKEWIVLNSIPREPKSYVVNPSLDFGEIINFGDLEIYVDDKKITQNKFVTSNKIEFRNSLDETLFKLPKPYAIDSKNTKRYSKIYLQYDVQKKGNKVWLYIKTPYSWLIDPERVYPVYIDASPETIEAGFDVFVDDEGPDFIEEYNDTIEWGSWTDNGPPYYSTRAGFDFNTSVIPDNATITQVQFKAYVEDAILTDETDMDEMSHGDVGGGQGASESYYDDGDESGFQDDADGNSYLSASTQFDDLGWQTVTLLPQARTDLQNQLGDDWFTVGVTGVGEDQDNNGDCNVTANENNGQDAEIIVTFTLPPIPSPYIQFFTLAFIGAISSFALIMIFGIKRRDD